MKTSFKQFLRESPIFKLVVSDDYSDVFGTLDDGAKQDKKAKVADQTDNLSDDAKKKAKYLNKLTSYLRYASVVNEKTE